jgi:hypothetical protein
MSSVAGGGAVQESDAVGRGSTDCTALLSRIAMKINITLEVAPNEVPLATELLAVLR